MTDQVENVFKSMVDGENGNNSANPDQGDKTGNNTGNAGQNDKGNNPESLLSQITNEQGEPKYKTVEDAIEALKHSQEHISTLERENQQFKERVTESKTVEQILEELDSTKRKSDDSQNDFSMEDIKKLVAETLEETEAQKAARYNQEAVVSTLQGQYGEKAEDTYVAKAEELGIPVQELNRLAAQSPKAVLQYFNISTDGPTSKNVQGSVNTEQFQTYNVGPQAPKPVMYGASTRDLVNSWKYAGEAIQQN